jgi:UrcA family protein
MKTRSAILAALGAATLASPALASTAIAYSDLNLETAQGQTQLDRRIDAAAREICGIADIRTGTILQGNKNKQCYDTAKASARKQVAERIARDSARGG